MKINDSQNIQKLCGVYIISNTIDDRIYIGSAKRFRRRYLDHKEQLRKGKHHSQHLQAFVNKYGIDKLIFTPVFECSTRDIAFMLEQNLLNKLKPKFNMTYKVFKHMEGIKISDESKAKQASTSYRIFKETNYSFVKELIILSQTILSNKDLATKLNVSESKIVEFKAKRGTFIKRLILEVEDTLGLLLNKNTSIQTQKASSDSKFLAKYGSVDNFRKELNIALNRLTLGYSKSKACIGLTLTQYALVDLLRGKTKTAYATELILKFKAEYENKEN